MAVRRRNCVLGASVHVDYTPLVRGRGRGFPRFHIPLSAAPCFEKPALKKTLEVRTDLHARVVNLATIKLDLPEDPEKYFSCVGGKEKGRICGSWDSWVRHFSNKRRRNKRLE